MAIALVQKSTSPFFSTTGTLPTSATAGNLLVAHIYATSTPSPPANWVLAVGSTTAKVWIYYYPNNAAGTNIFTFSNAIIIALSEWSGVATASPLDTSGINNAASSPVTATTTGNVSVANSLAVGVVADTESKAGTTTMGAGTGWTNEGDVGTSSSANHLLFSSRLNPTSGSQASEQGSSSSMSLTGLGVAIAVFKPPTGSNFTQGCSGSVTPSGAAGKAATLPKGGSTTGSGALTRSITTTKAGSTTAAGVPKKLVSPAVKAGSMTPVGGVVQGAQLAKGGSVTGSGAISQRSVAAVRAGSTTPAGSKQSAVNRLLSGSTTPSGSTFVSFLFQIFPTALIAVSGAIANLVSLAKGGSSTLTGAAGKAGTKSAAGTSSPAGVLAKASSVFKTGSATASGAVLRAVSAVRGGSVTPAGSIGSRAVSIFRNGSIAASGLLVRAASLVYGGSVSPAGSAAKAVSHVADGSVTVTGELDTGGADTILGLDGSTTPAGIVARAASAIKTGTVTASGSTVKVTFAFRSGSTSPSGTAATVLTRVFNLAASVMLAGETIKAVSKRLAGSATLTSGLTRNVSKFVTGVINFVGDLLTFLQVHVIAGNVRVFDTTSANLNISDVSPVTIYERSNRLTIGDIAPLVLRDLVSARAAIWDEVTA